jgi:hypothetical protein
MSPGVNPIVVLLLLLLLFQNVMHSAATVWLMRLYGVERERERSLAVDVEL